MRQIRIYGTLFVAGNLGGVFPIAGIPGVYKPNELSLWTQSIIDTPSAHILSALLFSCGAISGILLASVLFKKYRHAATWLGLGSLWNALFIPIPLILAELSLQGIEISTSVSEPLLLLAVFADALFNGCLAVTMIVMARTLWNTNRVLAISGAIIAVPTILVLAQFHARWAADLLGVAGPAWLAWWLTFSWRIKATVGPSPTAVQ